MMNINKTITVGVNTNNPLTINRFGYGTIRLTGYFVWGEPKNRKEALNILRSAVTNNINFIDTADFYGDDVTNRLIAEALHPYPDDLIICTKLGTTRKADKGWYAFDKPDQLRKSVEKNLKTLKTDQLKLVHLRIMPGSETPLEDSLNTMFQLKEEGKILHIGLSNVDPKELNQALSMGNIASVENAFGYHQRTSFQFHHSEYRGLQEVYDICQKNEIIMIPFWSLQNSLPKNDNQISIIANKYHASPAQINLAWLLHFHPLILPIPGTSQLKHFEENLRAREIVLTKEDMRLLG